ncbi:MAG: hydroxylamine reductase [Deltaproteobacteria bacterium]|nr:hydroxylamine reductase [Deltaproteobacteria bacterium]
MFCYQCQETLRNTGCTVRGVCGKPDSTSALMDLLIDTLKGVAVLEEQAAARRGIDRKTGLFLMQSLFMTITNANFDEARLVAQIEEALIIQRRLRDELQDGGPWPACATWQGGPDAFAARAAEVGVLAEADEDLRSLQQTVIYGLKGIGAYADHAALLGYEDDAVYGHMVKALAQLTRPLSLDALLALVLETGRSAVEAMALLDRANSEVYGAEEITRVAIGVRGNPGILVSGHDLRDLEDLLEETAGTGVDVYTHGEMLPAHYRPFFKKYPHLAGNYGGAWWKQDKEFASFNGPILMTTNCIIPVRDAYRDRIFTTGTTGYPGVPHIPDRQPGGRKDFSAIVTLARTLPPPAEIEQGEIVGGFGHPQVLALADRVVEAVRSGAIRRFVVMAGCDGRMKDRAYFTEVAQALPPDTIILTAGCAKYRYNKLALGEINGIPRVLDAGQCNDSYSLAVIALKLKEAFALEDVNDLPISFDIAWYEQKAVAVLLALLYLGFRNIRLGPTLPGFLSPAVARVLGETYGLRKTTTVAEDVPAIVAGA